VLNIDVLAMYVMASRDLVKIGVLELGMVSPSKLDEVAASCFMKIVESIHRFRTGGMLDEAFLNTVLVYYPVLEECLREILRWWFKNLSLGSTGSVSQGEFVFSECVRKMYRIVDEGYLFKLLWSGYEKLYVVEEPTGFTTEHTVVCAVCSRDEKKRIMFYGPLAFLAHYVIRHERELRQLGLSP